MATSSPQLTLPSSETIAAQATLDVGGISYADSFAAGNPGGMYLHIWDSAGLLSARNSAGVLVPGSGTNAITLTVPYADITAVLASLTYMAAATAGSDSISFDLWDQAGVETTGSIPVAVVAGGGGGTPTTDTWTGAVSSDWNTGGNWSSGSAPASGQQVVIPGGTPNTPALGIAALSGQAITLTTGGGQGGSANFTNVTLAAGSVLQNAASDTLPQPAMMLGGTFTVASGATLAAASGSLLTLQSAGAPAQVVNQGTIAGNDGHLNIDTGGTVVNGGLITASNSGGVGFDFGEYTNAMAPETILNSGTIQAAGGSLYLNGTVHGGTLQFSGAGEMVLEQQNALADGASIAGFGAGDTIDLYLINATSLSFANGVLTVMNGTTAVESLPMSGSYTTANFQMVFQPSQEFSNAITYVPGSGSGSITSGPQVNAPAAETVAAGGTLAVPGVSVTDSYAATNPGSMALNVTDSSGTLRMTGAGGAALAGSGTNAIQYTGSLTQVNAALATLSYAAGSAASDSITVDIWDQAGKEATRAIAVTVGGGSPTPTPTPAPTTTPTPTPTPSPAGGTVISGTSGDDTIVSNLNNVTINAGAGNDTVFAGGTGDTITATGGNNVIQAFAGGNAITTGAGNDTIRIAGSGNTVNAGGGINQISDSGSGNTLVLPGAGQGTDNVYGYVLAGQDTFDLRSALASAGWQGSQATLSDFLSVGATSGGADTTISVTPGGSGAGSVVATLYGNGAVPLASFLKQALVS